MKAFAVLTMLLISLCASSAHGDVWTQTSWVGGRGQAAWARATKYLDGWSEEGKVEPGSLSLCFPGWEASQPLEGRILGCLLQAHDGSVYAAEHDSGYVFKSTDSGMSWTMISRVPQGNHLWLSGGIVESSDLSLYASANGPSVQKSTDGGLTWQPTSDLPHGSECVYGLLAAHDALYFGSRILRICKTTDGGLTWDTTASPAGLSDTYVLFEDRDHRILAAGFSGKVIWSTNGGGTWNCYAPKGLGMVHGFSQAPDGAVYIAGWFLLKTIGCAQWESLAVKDTHCVLATSNETIYASGFPPASDSLGWVYRSSDNGNTWWRTGELFETWAAIVNLIELPDGTILGAGAAYGDDGETARVFRSVPPHGWATSSVFDAGELPEYGTASWSFTTQGDSPAVRVRTDTLLDMSTAPDWDLCPPATNGEDISFLSSVHDGQRYIQYRIEMRGWDNFSTPVFHDISIEYTPTGVTEDWLRLRSSGPSLMVSPSVFKKRVTLSFTVPESGHVEAKIFDIAGRPVRTLFDEDVSSDEHSLVWDGRDDSGRDLGSGVYFCSVRGLTGTGVHSITKKVVYLGR